MSIVISNAPTLTPLNQSYLSQNLGLSASVATNALTISLKQADGTTDPTTTFTGLIKIGFRNATATSGAYSLVSATAATSIVVPSGASLGQTSGVTQYVWVYALNNAGTIELAVSGVKLFDDYSIQSSTTIGAGSTSGTTLYSTTGRSNVPIRLIGRILVSEVTAGTWATTPSEVALVSGKQPVTMTDWVTYTPTFVGFGTPTGVTLLSKREGEMLKIRGQFTGGTPTATTASMTLGFNGTNSNVTTDANKVLSNNIIGVATYSVAAASMPIIVASPSSGVINFSIQSGGAAGGNPSTGSSWLASGVTASLYAEVAISGWSTNGP